MSDQPLKDLELAWVAQLEKCFSELRQDDFTVASFLSLQALATHRAANALESIAESLGHGEVWPEHINNSLREIAACIPHSR